MEQRHRGTYEARWRVKWEELVNEARGKGDPPWSGAPAPAPVTATPPAAAPAPATSASGDAAPRKSLADAEKTVLTPGTRPPAPEPRPRTL